MKTESIFKLQKRCSSSSYLHRKTIELSIETLQLAEKSNFDVKGYKFVAEKEDLRKPKIVRVRHSPKSTTIYAAELLLEISKIAYKRPLSGLINYYACYHMIDPLDGSF